jgi:hypothetical protein
MRVTELGLDEVYRMTLAKLSLAGRGLRVTVAKLRLEEG